MVKGDTDISIHLTKLAGDQNNTSLYLLDLLPHGLTLALQFTLSLNIGGRCEVAMSECVQPLCKQLGPRCQHMSLREQTMKMAMTHTVP